MARVMYAFGSAAGPTCTSHSLTSRFGGKRTSLQGDTFQLTGSEKDNPYFWERKIVSDETRQSDLGGLHGEVPQGGQLNWRLSAKRTNCAFSLLGEYRSTESPTKTVSEFEVKIA